MLERLRLENSRTSDYQVPAINLNNPQLIESRVNSAPAEAKSALRLVLQYLYLSDGPSNLRNPQYRLAEAFLEPYEIIISRYLKSRTNGVGRRDYGKPALIQMRSAGYKCECCGNGDVRVLHLDHVHGRLQQIFFVLCANCHNIKSRLYDWLGTKRGEHVT